MKTLRMKTVGVSLLIAVLACPALVASRAGAAEEASESSANPQAAVEAPQGKLTATVVEVKGMVAARIGEEGKWQRVKEGMTYAVNTEFRTGPASWVRFRLPPNQVFTLDGITRVKLLEAMRSDATGKIKTDLMMQEGRLHFEVHAGGIEHDVKVHTPGSTLAIRGTDGMISTRAGQQGTALYEGHVEIVTADQKKIDFGDKH